MGLIPTEMYASISWETTMLPSSVAMAVPERAVMMKAVRMGPSSRVITTMRIEYTRLVCPKRGRMVPPFDDDDRPDGKGDQGDDAQRLHAGEQDLQHEHMECHLPPADEEGGFLEHQEKEAQGVGVVPRLPVCPPAESRDHRREYSSAGRQSAMEGM